MALYSNVGAHELALNIINDGKTYQRRKELGRLGLRSNLTGSTVRAHAQEWVTIARQGAFEYERAFGFLPNGSCFTALDILGAALELAQYYEEHARECCQ